MIADRVDSTEDLEPLREFDCSYEQVPASSLSPIQNSYIGRRSSEIEISTQRSALHSTTILRAPFPQRPHRSLIKHEREPPVISGNQLLHLEGRSVGQRRMATETMQARLPQLSPGAPTLKRKEKFYATSPRHSYFGSPPSHGHAPSDFHSPHVESQATVECGWAEQFGHITLAPSSPTPILSPLVEQLHKTSQGHHTTLGTTVSSLFCDDGVRQDNDRFRQSPSHQLSQNISATQLNPATSSPHAMENEHPQGCDQTDYQSYGNYEHLHRISLGGSQQHTAISRPQYTSYIESDHPYLSQWPIGISRGTTVFPSAAITLPQELGQGLGNQLYNSNDFDPINLSHQPSQVGECFNDYTTEDVDRFNPELDDCHTQIPEPPQTPPPSKSASPGSPPAAKASHVAAEPPAPASWPAISPLKAPAHRKKPGALRPVKSGGVLKSNRSQAELKSAKSTGNLKSRKSAANLGGSGGSHGSTTKSPIKQDAASRAGPSKLKEFSFEHLTVDHGQRIMEGVAPSGSSKTKRRREMEAREKEKKMLETSKKVIERLGGVVPAELMHDVFNKEKEADDNKSNVQAESHDNGPEMFEEPRRGHG